METPPYLYNFQLGTTTIVWTATNAAGSDQCIQTIEVVDKTRPVIFELDPLEECVLPIIEAVYDEPTMDIMPERPDYFRFEEGWDMLDIDIPDFSDNCDLTFCAPFKLRWRIDFADGTGLPSTNPVDYHEGQPSEFDFPNDEILFPGDGVTFQPVVHTITYWIVDCNNNVSTERTRTFTIFPRPDINLTNE